MLADISKRLQGEPEVDPDFVEQTIYADQLWGQDPDIPRKPFKPPDQESHPSTGPQNDERT
ncbi:MULTISPECIES: hypothetical protein [Bradyrhizobium]|jgi:hypothetical protein|nr:MULTISPECIES: hypothetical protein [Bradyrhizobium]MCP1758816.1 hypothetical protein [Bradyrhizobium elkanii]MCP1975833.1 hypothetical protein [Bradyrhizobium elkanii]MCP1985012.1 hypothetical protein [Bradyrhizobium elkanii]MCS3890633.1 hypothetical protein [Bradyrhizobium elkanii]MCS4112885.1 hypothetical protein [Bradyrhizobium elkanii]